jgi:hypothetical protein
MPIVVLGRAAEEGDGSYNTTALITFDSAIGNGDAGILAIYGGATISGVVDNSSGTPAWTQALSTNSGLVQFYYRVNCSGSPTTATVTSSGSDFPLVHFLRCSGIDNADPEDEAGDVTWAQSGETFATDHSVDVSHANSGSLIVGIVDANTNARTFTGGTGVTVTTDGAGDKSAAMLDRVAAGAGPTTMAWTLSSGQFSYAAFVAFNAAAGGGGAVIPGASSYYRRLRA